MPNKAVQDPTIREFDDEYEFLSNFFPSKITYEGVTYPTVEHAFQAQKTLDNDHRIRMSKYAKPNEAKRAGGRLKLRKDWEEVKFQIMLELVRLKFRKGSKLAKELLHTGNAKLVEGNWWNDVTWGVCGGRGKNWLGKILMQIREELGGYGAPIKRRTVLKVRTKNNG
jgi:ribA/ribD-fused uncharacterized protein